MKSPGRKAKELKRLLKRQAIRRHETTLVVQIGDVQQVATTKNGKLDIRIFDHDPGTRGRK